MKPAEKNRLEEVLDRVAITDLRNAITRRTKSEMWQLNNEYQKQFRRVMKELSTKLNLREDQILNNDMATRYVQARWTLFAALHDRGWGLTEIRMATGLDRNVIRRGLERKNRLPTTKENIA